MCFVFIWEQTATCATYSTNWLVFITEMKCLQRGTDWVFKQSSLRFVFKRLNKTSLDSFIRLFVRNSALQCEKLWWHKWWSRTVKWGKQLWRFAHVKEIRMHYLEASVVQNTIHLSFWLVPILSVFRIKTDWSIWVVLYHKQIHLLQDVEPQET